MSQKKSNLKARNKKSNTINVCLLSELIETKSKRWYPLLLITFEYFIIDFRGLKEIEIWHESSSDLLEN